MSKVEIVTFAYTLLRLAREEALARKSGDEAAIEKAVTAHEEYKKLCLMPGARMVLFTKEPPP